MPEINLPCTTTNFQYPYTHTLATPASGAGKNEAAAKADALGKVPPDEVQKAIDAASNDALQYKCTPPCARNVVIGDPEFVATTTENSPTEWTAVIAAAEVQVTVTCKKKKLKAAAPVVVMADTPPLLRSIPTDVLG